MIPSTFSLGLCGFPLDHSLSPFLHEAALRVNQLTGSYTLFPISPNENPKTGLESIIEKIKRQEIQGLNITIPYKQTILSLVDQLTPAAKRIGAVNTIAYVNGLLVGENTDAAGFLSDVKKLPIAEEKNALVLGAGGASRAVVYALLSENWKVHVATRRITQTEALVATFQEDGAYRDQLSFSDNKVENLIPKLANLSLIVNATPVGMYPQVNGSPLPEDLDLPQGCCIYDLVYNPLETPFLRSAQNQGCPARNGLGMLIEQAALSFELWTGFSAPRQKMLENLPYPFNQQLGGSHAA